MSITEAPGLTPGASVKKRVRPEPVEHQVDRRTPAGSVLGTVQLDPEWFGHEPNVALMHQVVVAQLAAARSGTQSTKTRAEVAGGGAKPFRQKGMGRSRQGSTRAPHWVGGGVAFGPKPRSYRQRTPKKMIRQALRSALSDRAALERVVLVNDWAFEVPKTKRAVAALAALGIEGRILVVLGQDDVVAERSFGNLQRIQSLQVGELNAYDVLRNDWIVFTDESLPGGVGDISSHKSPEDADVVTTDVPEPDAKATKEAEATVTTDTETAATDTADTDTATDDDSVDSAVAESDDAVTDEDEASDEADDDTGETES